MPVRRISAAGVATILVLALVSCSGDSQEATPEPTKPTKPVETSTQAPTTLTRPDAPLQVGIKQLTGRYPHKQRARLRHSLAKPVASWMRGGFLGHYPRGNFSQAFTDWTPQAKKLGRKHRRFTTNAAVGRKTVAAVADRRRARLYVFAHSDVTGGATARVLLRLTTEQRSGRLRHFVVKGDLYLTRDGGHWRVFGFDLDRTEVR